AHVVEPLLEVFVVRAGEEDRVFVEQASQRGLRSEAVVRDPAADLAGEGGIAEDRLVYTEDGGFVVPNLLLYLMLQRTKLRGRLVTGGLETGKLGRNFVVLQTFGVGIHENLVNAERGSDSHAGRYRNSLAHKRQNVPLTAEDDKWRRNGGTLQTL